MLKYAAAYALWYKPYNSRKRAIFLSMAALFSVYFLVIGAIAMFARNPRLASTIEYFFQGLWGLHEATYGAPYLIAIVIGWFFARKAPDARDSF